MTPTIVRKLTAIALLAVASCGHGSDGDVDAAANAQHLEDDRAAAQAKEANAKAIAKNADTLTALRKDVEAADRKIAYSKEKAAKEGSAGSDPRATAASATVDTKAAAVKADLDAMEKANASPSAFDAAKAQYDVDKAALDAAASAFGDLLKK